ncbi:hypothetical protein LHYA1_G004879 [Lachnellula hyalina]|uniref:Uncharacterized protein n=1 Tax=Lachnellula hyalina TaxID=1316788 RepID=A0A8H8U240_9HELO|nr:uncharacterized protein LHYA1_G004879 [Lachnellula hyalina]TVY27686.1 hypothetical protein LHYA1_G004879 [Lachnellula hyalina]
MTTSQWNSTPTCAGSEPYEDKLTGPNNTCAWLSGNYSASTQANISSCCGPNNTPYPYSIFGTPPGCFQMCNITNGTYAQLYQNMEILETCLNEAGAGDLYCHWQTPPATSGLRRVECSWVNIGVVGLLLVGTAVWGL